MNKPIRTMSIFCLILFLALMGNATYLQFWASGSLNEDPLNRRVLEEAYSRERGAILVGRQAIARSRPSDDRYEFQRRYPEPFKYAPVTGSFSLFNQTGLERTQNEVLSGEDPRLFVTRLVDLVTNESTQGGSVEITLDPDAQTAAHEGLVNGLPGNAQASVVALEPSTGKILAMASVPSYDPNLLATHDSDAMTRAYERLNDDDAEPLVNRAVQKRLPPGSTFKLVTAAAALEDGRWDANGNVPAGAVYDVPQTSSDIGNDGRTACNPAEISFALALEQSCNTTFARLANQLGTEKMRKQAEAFGFNDDEYFDELQPLAESTYPLEADEPQTAQTGIGQFEVATTPLQMAMVAAGIANDGVVMKPYLVNKVQSADYQDLEQTDPTELSEAMSASSAEDLTDLLVSVVDRGTASPAAIPNVRVAGKTGTAQSGIDGVSPYAWFVSFAPADDPQVAVAVMIESADIERSEVAGGAWGGPIAKAVMEAVIK